MWTRRRTRVGAAHWKRRSTSSGSARGSCSADRTRHDWLRLQVHTDPDGKQTLPSPLTFVSLILVPSLIKRFDSGLCFESDQNMQPLMQKSFTDGLKLACLGCMFPCHSLPAILTYLGANLTIL